MLKRKKEGGPLGDKLFPYLMVAPAVILFTAFVVYPFVRGLYISFFRWNGLSAMKPVGLKNYLNIFHDSDFWSALRHTLYYALCVTILKNVFGFSLAMLMKKITHGKGFFRTIIYMPVTLSYVVCGMLWTWIFNPTFGLLNNFLTLIGAEGLILGWLSDPKVALYSIMVVDAWRWAGFHMVLYLAGLQSIPQEYYEAAEVDGANAFNRFWHITVPQLNSVIVLNILMAVTGAMVSNYDIVNVMTDGGPFGSTEVAMTYIYRTAFEFNNLGKASAMSIVMFLATLVFGLLQISTMTHDENYGN